MAAVQAQEAANRKRTAATCINPPRADGLIRVTNTASMQTFDVGLVVHYRDLKELLRNWFEWLEDDGESMDEGADAPIAVAPADAPPVVGDRTGTDAKSGVRSGRAPVKRVMSAPTMPKADVKGASKEKLRDTPSKRFDSASPAAVVEETVSGKEAVLARLQTNGLEVLSEASVIRRGDWIFVFAPDLWSELQLSGVLAVKLPARLCFVEFLSCLLSFRDVYAPLEAVIEAVHERLEQIFGAVVYNERAALLREGLLQHVVERALSSNGVDGQPQLAPAETLAREAIVKHLETLFELVSAFGVRLKIVLHSEDPTGAIDGVDAIDDFWHDGGVGDDPVANDNNAPRGLVDAAERHTAADDVSAAAASRVTSFNRFEFMPFVRCHPHELELVCNAGRGWALSARAPARSQIDGPGPGSDLSVADSMLRVQHVRISNLLGVHTDEPVKWPTQSLRGNASIVTLVGPPGSHKSSLLQALQFFIELHPLREAERELLADKCPDVWDVTRDTSLFMVLELGHELREHFRDWRAVSVVSHVNAALNHIAHRHSLFWNASQEVGRLFTYLGDM